MALEAGELARRVELLFAVVVPRSSAPPTTGALVAGVNLAAGAEVISGGVVDGMRTGNRPETSVDECTRVSEFFGVPAGYLTGTVPAARVEAQLRMLAGVREWDALRLAALLGALAELVADPMIGVAESAAEASTRQPVCLRLGRTWRPPEDDLNAGRDNDQRLWRRCEAMVRDLEQAVGIPPRFVPEQFLDRLAEHRGRPIELRPFTYDELPDGVCGLWARKSDRDVIGWPVKARHAPHIVFHEVGHMIGEHRGQSAVALSLLRSSMPDLDPEIVEVVLGRSVYGATEEREAELFASLVMARYLGASRQPSRDDTVLDPVAQRLRRTFGG